jgi:hypothetical protein
MGWTWRELDGWAVGRPCLASFPGDVEIFALNIHNQVMHRLLSADGWSLSFLGAAELARPPVLKHVGGPALGVIQRSGKAAPSFVALQPFSTSLYEEDLGGAMCDAAAIAISMTRQYIVVRGTNNAFYMKSKGATGGWSDYADIPGGGLFPSPPDMVFRGGPYQLELITRGMDNRIWHNQYNGLAWRAWVPLGTMQSPWGGAVALLDDYRVMACAAGPDNRLCFAIWSNGVWGAWQPMAGSPLVFGDPCAESLGAGKVMVAFRGIAGTIHVGQATL